MLLNCLKWQLYVVSLVHTSLQFCNIVEASTCKSQFLSKFKVWAELKMSVSFLETEVISGLMPKIKVPSNGSTWFHSAIVLAEIVHDPVLIIGDGNYAKEWHRDTDPPTAVVSSLLRGKKLRIFASKFYSAASRLSRDVMKSPLDRFVEDLMYRRYSNLSFCVQYPGDTVVIPALTGHFVSSATEDSSWHVLLTHNIKKKGSSARALDIITLNIMKTQKDRVVGDQCRKRTGKTKKRFGARKRRHTTSK